MQAAADASFALVWTVLRGKQDQRASIAYCGCDEAAARHAVELYKHRNGENWRPVHYQTGNDDEWWINARADFVQLQLHLVRKIL